MRTFFLKLPYPVPKKLRIKEPLIKYLFECTPLISKGCRSGFSEVPKMFLYRFDQSSYPTVTKALQHKPRPK